MKSSSEDLRKRGMPSKEELEEIEQQSYQDMCESLHGEQPTIRSAAAVGLRKYANEAVHELLQQLKKETCLYTRIAICETLETGNCETARCMCEYLGKVGNNQHKKLPEKVSEKKSFPLARDIIARSLGRMDLSIFSILMEVLETGSTMQISEVLDAIGYMVFYHRELATEDICKQLIVTVSMYKENEVLLWKLILCLSAFSCDESIQFLSQYKDDSTILGLEATRSLKLLL